MKLSSRISALLARTLFGVACLFPLTVSAQNLFAPAAYVNDKVITEFEVEQRSRFLQVLGAPGDLREEARERLIEERLQLSAASRFNLTVSDEQIQGGIDEFASRANLSGEQLLVELDKAGIAPQTMRDFVSAGLIWRELVQGLFGPRAQISEAELDRALAQTGSSGGLRVLLSEIILPTTPEFAARTQALLPELQRIDTIAAFSTAASQYSASPSRARGGQLDWRAASALPPEIRNQVLSLRPGQVSRPIEVNNAVALFQLRDKRQTEAVAAGSFTVEYAQYYLPGGRSADTLRDARGVREDVDTCGDLYGVNKDNPEEQLVITTLPESDVPADIRRELDKLDANEVSTALTRNNGQTLVFLMLCGRTPTLTDDIAREDVRRQLVNDRLVSFATSYMEELRADALIRIP